LGSDKTLSASKDSLLGTSPRPRQYHGKLILLLVSASFSTAAFLTFDWLRTASIYGFAASGKLVNCRVSDPVRHHAFKPNCASVERWGGEAYQFFTNSLGFRDQQIRQVPLADQRPRILVLGDSFTEGKLPWQDSYVGRIAAHFPEYDFLNGGVASYSPSNYLNVTRMVLAAGIQVDEVIVFIDMSDVSDEAAFYRDKDASGAVTGPERELSADSRYAKLRQFITRHFLLTNYLLEFFERSLVKHGYYHLNTGRFGDEFDMELSAWSYREVNERVPCPAGYAPLGVEGGIAKEKAKMTLLWQDLEKHAIPISVAVYPWPAQIVHDSADSRQVRIWREWCDGKCKRFISVFPAFLALKNQCPKSQPGCWYLSHFIFGDNHYNAAGNVLVANAVIRSMEEEPPRKLPPPGSPVAIRPDRTEFRRVSTRMSKAPDRAALGR